MTINLSNSLAGLSLLTGSNALFGYGTAVSGETRAVRQAKALFTTPATTPPWREAASRTPVSSQVAAIKRMATIVDKPATGSGALPEDVQTAFTTYKALDRLRLLAESAAKTGTSATERTLLQTAFAKGIGDLESFLGTAPSDLLNLAFAQPARRGQSVGMVAPAALLATKTPAEGVMTTRAAALPGLTGTEKFQIKISQAGSSGTLTVDLAGTPQPPTLDSVATAFNDAIAASGWNVRFAVEKHDDKWGFAIVRQGLEKVEIDQIGAGDALMVASGVTTGTAATATRVTRFDDPAGAMTRQTLGTFAAIDSAATARAEMLASAAPTTTTKTGSTPPAPETEVQAPTTAAGIATDAQGFSYVVGTSSGDLGANRSEGAEDMVLSKLDSEGRVVWQRSLGATGSASGAAVTLAADGSIVVAGTVKGGFDGVGSDGDMLVARFDAKGDETFSTLVRAAGADSASAVAVGNDGSIYVGGRSASGGGDAFLARLDAGGVLRERRTIDSGGADAVSALAIDAGGNLLALTREGGQAMLRRIDPQSLAADQASLNLGSADARALAVAADGSIAVGGATLSALPGSQVNATGGGRDGFVARIDAALTSASVTYIATGADDQVDSIAFLGGALYAGGRTAGALNGARTGSVDGFVSRIDLASGAVQSTSQFGQASTKVEPVRVSAAQGGDTVLGALGLHRGTLTPDDSAKLVAQTSLRAGDEFAIRVNGGSVRKITIGADDTLTSLADRVRRITGSKATIGTPKVGDDNVLRIEAKAGTSIELIAGAAGKDALAKLGLPEARITAAAPVASNAPRVRPGGSYGLGLTSALAIGTAQDAGIALARIKQAISVTQTGYRSLYWDDTKAALVDGTRAGGAATGREAAQMAQYQAALDRLSGGNTNMWGF